MSNLIDEMLRLVASKTNEMTEANAYVTKYTEKAAVLKSEIESLEKTIEILRKESSTSPLEPPVVKRIIIKEPVVSDCTEEPASVKKERKRQTFADFIRDYKYKNKMTNDMLGELLNFTGQTVWKWTKGYSLPSEAIVNDVYEALNAHSLVDKGEFLDSIEWSKKNK